MPVDLSTLNEGQLAAVHAPLDKPTLVIAGAGTGKTTTLSARLEHLVSSGVDPSAVVAMTFTRKAAGEFAERLSGGPGEAVWSGTIHSFAYRRLKAYREATGEPSYEVLAHIKPHVRRLIGRKTEGYEEAVDAPELDLSAVLGRIDGWQNELIDPLNALYDAEGWIDQWSAKIYEAYTTWKRRRLKIDFGDMLSLTVRAYQSDAGFLEGDRIRFRYGLVDELQDTNTAQWRLAHLLWSDQPIFGVGDPRQAIYEWRGARPSQLLSFADLWPGVEIIFLVDNYRSTPQIIDVAERVMAGTVESKASGRLVPNRDGGRLVRLEVVPDQWHEADWIVDEIEATYPIDFQKLGEAAILYRTNAQSVDFEDALAERDIPYQVVGSKGFWARSEIRQLLAYIELAEDHDDREAFATALVAPSRFLGKAFIEAASQMADDRDWTITEACGHVTTYSGRALNGGQGQAASDFTTLIRSLRSLGPKDALDRVLQKTDFRSWLRRNEGSADSADDNRDDLIAKLVEHAEAFPTRSGLLTHAEKMRSRASSGTKPDPNRVQLLTIHRAKGLEWPVVFVAGFSEGLLPHYLGNPDEERRLAYVAMTRARDRLYLTSPQSTYRGPTGVSEFAVDAGLVRPTTAAVGVAV